eukprot:Phypoly_transcript_15454.p1 GENE.Phypoly_transcript_15454~~Phypoly_transcript_15454.p1  ORF type:complete len:209 (+),score=35.02 Phypoly_transcript_15454:112-738(+)
MPDFNMEKLDVQLLQAARDGDLGTVKEIVTQQGKEVLNKCTNEQGQTPLHLASRHHHLEVVREIILNGADLNTPDKSGRTPLHAAMSLERRMDSENLQVVKLLVDNGADLGKTDAEGLTPIHEASRSGRVHVMQWLLDQHPYDFLPGTYLPREPSESPHDTTYMSSCHSTLLWLLAWVYPAAEITAGVVCCLPVWQTCSATTASRDDE